MGTRTDNYRASLADLDERIKLAENAHQQAKSVFSRYEGPASTPMWERLRREVDSTLTHVLVLQATWHRIKADLLESLNDDRG